MFENRVDDAVDRVLEEGSDFLPATDKIRTWTGADGIRRQRQNSPRDLELPMVDVELQVTIARSAELDKGYFIWFSEPDFGCFVEALYNVGYVVKEHR